MINIIVADDHNLFREGLTALLHAEEGIDIVATAANGRDTVRLAKQHLPDVVVMDVAMPGLNGIDAARQILELRLGCRVLALSSTNTEQAVRDMLQAGAMGYLIKECAGDELIRAIHTVASGQLYLSSAITETVVTDYLSRIDEPSIPVSRQLTSREREVLQLIAEGSSTASVAETLSLSVKTIESHRQKIMQKLNIKSIAGLTKYAIREGLTSV